MKNNPRLIHFGTKAFGHTVISLEELYLSNNDIEVFPEELARNGDHLNFNLKKLDITGNPLRCDCHLDWIRKVPEVIGDPKCTFPKNLVGFSFMKLESGNLTCPNAWWDKCPGECICYRWRNGDVNPLQLVDCRAKKINEFIPYGIPAEVTALDLSQNMIASFKDNAFVHLRNLKYLNLDGRIKD